MALCSALEESSTTVGDRSRTSTEVSRGEGKKPADGERNVAVASAGGAGSSPAAGPSPEEVAYDGLDMAALVLHEEEHKQGEDFFMWLHPTNPCEALFAMDDVTERTTWDDVS